MSDDVMERPTKPMVPASEVAAVRELLVVERETSDRLRNALDKYGRHRVYCPMFPTCTCGFDEARR